MPFVWSVVAATISGRIPRAQAGKMTTVHNNPVRRRHSSCRAREELGDCQDFRPRYGARQKGHIVPFQQVVQSNESQRHESVERIIIVRLAKSYGV
jgi:hypothetical protein